MSDQEYAVRPNKSQLKREIRALNDLGKELSKLPSSQLQQIPLSEVMRREIILASKLERGALQRQLRRVASLMQNEEVDEIRAAFERLKQPDRAQIRMMHKLESFRDRLIAQDDSVLNEIQNEFGQPDFQHLRQLQRNAIAELKAGKPPKNKRLIFKYLTELSRQV